MKALITGASSGLGWDMAKILSRKGYELILTARRQDRLEALQKELPGPSRVIVTDLSRREECFALYEQVKGEGIDLLVNNAGYGVFGSFLDTDLEQELNMLDLNIGALHILTKLFLRDFVQRDRGTILNVASSAAFLPGPLLSSYYGSKAYVLRLTEAVYEELRRKGSHVQLSVLCPGPVDTEFSQRAGVSFSLKGLDSPAVAEYAIRQMERGQLVIIPGTTMKLVAFIRRLTPMKMLLQIAYQMQKQKEG